MVASIAVFVGLISACGNSDAELSGSLLDVSVTPEAAYAGVEIEVSIALNLDEDHDEDDFGWAVEFGDGNGSSGQSIEATTTHAYQDVNVDGYTIVVEGLQNGSVVDTVELNLPVYDPVDLSVDAVNASPANVFVDESLTVSFDIRNQQASPVITPFAVRAYLSQEPNVDREDLDELDIIGEQRFELEDGIVLNEGQRRNVGINAATPDVPTGNYYAIVVIDPEQHLGLINPEATIASSSRTILVENVDSALPNISITDLEVLPDRAFPELSQFTRAFTLSNIGNADIFEVVYKTYIQVGSRELDDDAEPLHISEPVNLSAQQSMLIGPDQFVLTEPIVPPVGEEEEVYVIVEAFSEDGDVQEATQSNNVAVLDDPIIVSDEPVDGPDIVVDHFAVYPDSTYLDGTLELEATISNQGTEDVSSFFCGIYMGTEPQINFNSDPQPGTLNVIGLGAGETQVLDREFTVPAVHDPGVYYFYIVCDPVGVLDQQFRGNSQFIHLQPVTITDEADIDLYVQNISLPATGDDGDIITVDTTICVAGTNSSGTTTGELYIGSGSDVDFDGPAHKTFDVPNVNPGECLDIALDVEAQCHDFNDEMSVGIFVDPEGTLPEEDTSNNQLVSSDPIQLSGAYCECVEDNFGSNQSPFSAYPVDDGSYSGSLCVADECDFFSAELDTGDSLLVYSEHDTDRGPLETTLFAPGGVQQLDKDSNDDHQEVGRFLAPDDGLNYVFSICGQDAQARNYYDFDVEIIEQPATVDVLPRDITIPSQDTFSVGSVLDVDFRIYNLGQQPTGDFQAELVLTTEREVGGAADLTLATHTIESMSSGSHVDVSIPAPLSALVDDDDYYIAVVLDPDEDLDDANPDNNIGFSPQFEVETQCFDAFTPNNSFAEAAPIDVGTYSNLIACAGESDYFEICAPNAHSLDISVSFNSANGDIDAILYDQTLSAIDSSAQTGVDLEEVGVDYVDGDQCYYLRTMLISLDDDAENDYSINISTSEVDPSLQCDPTFEPNDDFSTATSLWAALDHDGTINRCPKDDLDFYAVYLSPDSTVDFSATLEPASQPGTLQLQLYRPNQVPEASDESGPGMPTASITDFTPSTTGTHFLRVSVTGDEHLVDYELSASGLPGVDLAVENLNIGAGTYVVDDQIRFDFDLSNYGGTDVSSVDYEVYIGDSALPSAGDDLLGSFTVASVDADETIEIEGQTNVPAAYDQQQTHYIHVIVDPDDDHNDVNLNNNRDTVPIEIVEPDDDDDDDGSGA